MNKMIACCGLNCEKCDAYIATVNNDDDLRAKTAKKWTEMNHHLIEPEWINCEGCRTEGIKFYFCSNLCEIRKCVKDKGYETCGNCFEIDACPKVRMIHENCGEARENLV